MVRFEKRIIERDSCHIFNEWKLEIGEFDRVEHDDDDDDDMNDDLHFFYVVLFAATSEKLEEAFHQAFKWFFL